jgi:hypothetical protein
MNLRCIVAFVCAVSCSAWATEVLWAGLTVERVPSFEQEFERQLRENLLVHTDITMVDHDAALQMQRKIDFDQFAAVSRRLVEKVMDYIPDSTIIVWGRVTDFTIKPRRSGFLNMGAHVTGSLSMVLNIYSLRFQRYAFAGDLTCSAEIPKGVIWFYPLDVAVQITAEDRAQIMIALQKEAAMKCGAMIYTVIRGEVQKYEKMYEGSGMKKYEEASISDLFKIPSVEATHVDSLAKDSAKVKALSDSSKTKKAVIDTTNKVKQPADSTAKKSMKGTATPAKSP